ncbi:MAG: DUF1178 family protein [Paracoccaceae bacterium]
MIRYALKCDRDHSFESWFRSAKAFDALRASDMVACVVCGSTSVKKAIMAPRVAPHRQTLPPNRKAPPPTPAPRGILSEPASPAEQMLRELRTHIEERSENVGQDFAREARAIFEGNAPRRPIIGEAKPQEAKSLIEDGIPVAPLPWCDGSKTN